MLANIQHSKQQVAVKGFLAKVQIAWREFTDLNDYTNHKRIPYDSLLMILLQLSYLV